MGLGCLLLLGGAGAGCMPASVRTGGPRDLGPAARRALHAECLYECEATRGSLNNLPVD